MHGSQAWTTFVWISVLWLVQLCDLTLLTSPLQISVKNMTCASCSASVENALRWGLKHEPNQAQPYQFPIVFAWTLLHMPKQAKVEQGIFSKLLLLVLLLDMGCMLTKFQVNGGWTVSRSHIVTVHSIFLLCHHKWGWLKLSQANIAFLRTSEIHAVYYISDSQACQRIKWPHFDWHAMYDMYAQRDDRSHVRDRPQSDGLLWLQTLQHALRMIRGEHRSLCCLEHAELCAYSHISLSVRQGFLDFVGMGEQSSNTFWMWELPSKLFKTPTLLMMSFCG